MICAVYKNIHYYYYYYYLQIVPDKHDPTSILICQLAFVALYNIFRAENHLHIEIKWVRPGKE